MAGSHMLKSANWFAELSSDRRLPNCLEAERALLGALFADNAVLARLPPGFDCLAFFDPIHAEIFSQIVELVARGETADFVTVGTHFASAEPLDCGTTIPKYIEWVALNVVTIIFAPNYANVVLDCARERLAESQDTSWQAALIRTAHGAIKPILANVVTALRSAPAWRYVLGYDELAMNTIFLSRPPFEPPGGGKFERRACTEADDVLITDWMQHRGISCGVETVQKAIETVAQGAKFHPIREYLVGLRWDNKPRIDSFAATYLGAASNDYTTAVSRCVLISAVARIMTPGCKADLMLVLEGSQGTGKSSALAALGGTWHTDELADFGSKDAAMQSRGAWIIEISELDAMSRSEASRIKAFVSRSTDRFRPPYGRRVIQAPRQCIFIGTTNAETYLKDETGARRFLPIKTGKIDVAAIRGDRDQIWAEALSRFKRGEQWWLTANETPAAAAEQASRYVEDPWQSAIGIFVEDRDEVRISEILNNALHLAIPQQGQIEQNRVARCLRQLGWRRRQIRGAKRYWAYVPVMRDGGLDAELDKHVVTPEKAVTT